MDIIFKKLTAESEDLDIFGRINDEAFPPSEHMSTDELLRYASATDTDLLGVYDGERPVGFTVVTKNDRVGYIFFLAIDSSLRSMGYGSAVLKGLLERYSELQMTLDFEVVDERADNYEQRCRRRRFYLRNGFHETGRFTMLRGELFELVCSENVLDVDGISELLREIHANCPDFSEKLM